MGTVSDVAVPHFDYLKDIGLDDLWTKIYTLGVIALLAILFLGYLKIAGKAASDTENIDAQNALKKFWGVALMIIAGLVAFPVIVNFLLD